MKNDHENFQNICADIANGSIAIALASIGGYFLYSMTIKPICNAIKEHRDKRRLTKHLMELDHSVVLDFEELPDQKEP